MLIIEGSDLVGKTTLAQKIVARACFKECGYIYRHLSRPPKAFDWRRYQEFAHRFTVQDRFHMSAPVYAAMRGDKEAPNPEQYRIIDGQLRQLGAFTVVVTASQSLLRERMREGEMYNIEQVLCVNQTFMHIADRKRWGVWNGYQMDVDYFFHCCNNEKFVTDDAIDDIVDAYITRQFTMFSTWGVR